LPSLWRFRSNSPEPGSLEARHLPSSYSPGRRRAGTSSPLNATRFVKLPYSIAGIRHRLETMAVDPDAWLPRCHAGSSGGCLGRGRGAWTRCAGVVPTAGRRLEQISIGGSARGLTSRFGDGAAQGHAL
jgi:hypothetical protein